METFILKLAVAICPLALLVASVTIIPNLSSRHTHHSLAWRRRRSNFLRTLAGGVTLR